MPAEHVVGDKRPGNGEARSAVREARNCPERAATSGKLVTRSAEAGASAMWAEPEAARRAGTPKPVPADGGQAARPGSQAARRRARKPAAARLAGRPAAGAGPASGTNANPAWRK